MADVAEAGGLQDDGLLPRGEEAVGAEVGEGGGALGLGVL